LGEPIQSQHCIRIPCRKSGAGFVSRCFVDMEMEMGIKKFRDPGIFKPKIWMCAKKLMGTRAG